MKHPIKIIDNLPFVQVKIRHNNKELILDNVLIDTGSAKSILKEKIVEKKAKSTPTLRDGNVATIEDKHHLVFSDGIIHTQEIIEIMEGIKAKNKIIFLDCCFSGNFNVNGTYL